MSKRALFWTLATFVFLALPFVVLMTGARPDPRGFWWEFSMGLGFGALAVSSMHFILTARFRRISHPFGIDILYLFHRYMAWSAVALMLAHFGILYVAFEEALGELNPLEARWELTSGRVSLLAFLALIVTSEFRKWLKLDYEFWRYLHVALALIAFGAAIGHIVGVGNYTAEWNKRALWLGVTFGWVFLLLWLRIGKPFVQKRAPWRVVENRKERGGVHTLILEPDGHEGLKTWLPGQFGWLTLHASPYALHEHPFTISTPPEDAPRIGFSIKPLGDFSATLIKTKPGTRAYLDAPYGVFSIDHFPDAKGFIMIAGGIGVTPMIANIRALASRGDPRPVTLLYFNNEWSEITFRDELEALSTKMPLKVVHVLDEPPEDWVGETGRLSKALLARHITPEMTDWPAFLCGPGPMVDEAEKALEELGLPLHHIETEIFEMV